MESISLASGSRSKPAVTEATPFPLKGGPNENPTSFPAHRPPGPGRLLGPGSGFLQHSGRGVRQAHQQQPDPERPGRRAGRVANRSARLRAWTPRRGRDRRRRGHTGPFGARARRRAVGCGVVAVQHRGGCPGLRQHPRSRGRVGRPDRRGVFGGRRTRKCRADHRRPAGSRPSSAPCARARQWRPHRCSARRGW